MAEKLNETTNKILEERFAKDSIIGLATDVNGFPSVRNIDAFYDDGCFYSITYALSNKIKEIESNPKVAIAGEWFTAYGKGKNLGYIYNKGNLPIAEKLKKAFAAWYDNGHNNYEDKNTIILCIELTDGVLCADGTRYEIDFTK